MKETKRHFLISAGVFLTLLLMVVWLRSAVSGQPLTHTADDPFIFLPFLINGTNNPPPPTPPPPTPPPPTPPPPTPAPSEADGFFIMRTPDIDGPTAQPTVKVDGHGGVHVVFTPQSAPPDNPSRAAYYAYCATNCTNAAAFTIVPVGQGVDFAVLDLDAQGHPRLLLRVPLQSETIFLFQYWTCDANCLNPAQWTGDSIGYTYARPAGWVEAFTGSFALDHMGRPRFVYYDNGADHEDPHRGAFYAYCDDDCTVAANWYETRILEDQFAAEFVLQFSSSGQPRLSYTTSNGDDNSLAYAECQQNCGNGANWTASTLANTVSASVTAWAVHALAVDQAGKPHIALYTGTGIGGDLAPGTLYYLVCLAANCATPASWGAVNLDLPQTHGEEGLALALDAHDRPRIAYHAPMAAGFGLYYAWCDAGCGTPQSWQAQKMEASEEVNAELPIPPWSGCPFPECDPPIGACTMSSWDTGVRPSLALDAAGHPRIAYDADHRQGGPCGTFVDTKLTRYIQFNQP